MSEAQEQEARIALLEHFTSQMQGYKLYILTLVLGSVGFFEFWYRFAEAQHLQSFVQAFLLPIVIGFFCATLFYCLARVAWYGALASTCISQVPYSICKMPNSPLLARLNQKTCDEVRDNPLGGTASFFPRSIWKGLIGLGRTDRQPVLAFTCLLIWFLVWASFFLLICALIKA